MELSAPQIFLDPFGVRALHTRHPQDMELGSRASLSSRPVFSTSSAPASHCIHKIEALDRTNESIESPSYSSQSISEAGSDVEPSSKQHGPSGAGKRPNAATAKRPRPLDDVDGPGTAELSVKKRRLLLRLVTSRLSHPFSLPATNILIRESGDNMPVLHRIQHCVGARRAGHQSALIRKAAILNRVRIGVRTAAISRGHMIMADLAARGNALNHGLLLVTTPAPAMFPARGTVANGNGNGDERVPPAWRPHTTSFHPPVAYRHYYSQQPNHSRGVDVINHFDSRCAGAHQGGGYTFDPTTALIRTNPHRKELPLEQGCLFPTSRHTPSVPPPADVSDEEDTTAFPSASFQDRYADLSDDDMDDIYADFGVLFGSGARSPETRAVGSPVEEQFYEEYLDELDGIPWVM
ncbi:hypothetical protein F4859DRAFT_213013 [Xylaria cf. heliscus]|nr:hypothetical protein F4859DRAFT_213013 [Xylaria cf. heliscus]